MKSVINNIKSIIFTKGKIHPLYCKYMGYSFVSNVIVSIETAIATDNMLYSIDTNSNENKTLNYLGKDIIGQIGGILYMSKMAHKADTNTPNFLLYSNILQQSSYIVMCITPFYTSYFLPIAGLSNILANISFTGFGAVNAKCIQKISENNTNIDEIYSKITVFNTLGSTLGLSIGMYINYLIPDHNIRLCIIPFLGGLRVLTFHLATKDLIN